MHNLLRNRFLDHWADAEVEVERIQGDPADLGHIGSLPPDLPATPATKCRVRLPIAKLRRNPQSVTLASLRTPCP